MKNLESIWVAVGIALTTATQLRPSSPVGVGEVMLAAWILLVAIRLSLFRDFLITPFARIFLFFWMVAFTSLTLGVLIGESNGLTSEGVYHDAFAFIFSFVFCSGLNVSQKIQKNFKELISVNISFTTIALAILFLFGVPFLAPWYGGSRFTGWANNPNQLALLITMLPFLALHLINQSSNQLTKIWYYSLIVLSVIVGIATDSDALMVGWLVGFLVTIVLAIYLKFLNHIKDTKVSRRLITIYQTLIGMFVFFVFLISLYVSYGEINSASTNIYDKGNQGSDRINLWRHGIAAIYYSPLFGIGPGAHSGIKEPFLDFEAHNTFIDWGGSSGIIGLIAYVALLGWVGWKAWRNGFVVLAAAVISLIAFSSFHFVLRHAIFWFYLLSIANLSANPLKDRHSMGNSNERMKNYLRKT